MKNEKCPSKQMGKTLKDTNASVIIDNEALHVNNSDKRNTVIRVVHNRENPFVQLNKQALWDETLSLKAVGLWARCMSRPNNWKFSIKELVTRCKEGRKAIDAAMKELIDAGYAYRLEYSERSEDGKFKTSGIEYVFFEFPATQEEKDEQYEIFKKSFQHCRYGNSRYGNFRNGHLLIKNNTKKQDSKEKEKTPLISPQKEEAADAASACVPLSSKDKKEKPIFSPKVIEVTKAMLSLLMKHNPVYRPPEDLTKFFGHVRDILDKDKQDEVIVLKTFEWAVSDNEQRGDFNGWQGIIATNTKGGKLTTPAEIFRKHFSKIHSQMRAKPKRTFGASSDDEAAMDAMREMNERAL